MSTATLSRTEFRAAGTDLSERRRSGVSTGPMIDLAPAPDMTGIAWGADGAAYLGQNLQAFGGGIGQPGKTLGGFFEGRLMATQRLQFNSGFGSNHLTRFDMVPVDLNRNTGIFANTIFQFTPEVAASFEYRHLVTRPFSGALRRNEHLDVGIAYSF